MGIIRQIPLFALAAVAVLVLGLSTANADHGHHRADVHFHQLTMDLEGHLLTVDYTVDADDWERIERLGVTPRFDLYIPVDRGDDVYLAWDVELYDRSGAFEIRGHSLLYRIATVRFDPVEEYWTERAGDVRLGGDFGHTLEFPLYDAPTTYRSTGSDRSSDDRRSDRRDRSRRGSDERRDRDRRGDRDRRRDRDRDETSDETEDRAAIVDACGDATTFSSSRQHCVETAPDIGFGDAAETVEACGRATSHSSTFQACLDVATDFRAAPSPTVRACGEAASHSSHFESCLKAASDYEDDASSIVESCGDSTNFGSRIAECVESATR